MRGKIKKLKLFLVSPFFLLILLGIFQCRADLDEGKYYVRIRYIEESLTIQRATQVEAEEAIVNMPLMAGDRVWTGEDGRAELIFEDGTILRIDHYTKLDFQAVSYYSKEYDNATILRLWSGSICINAINIEDSKRNFQIDTPSSSIYLISDGSFRIDVFEEGETRLTSFNGVAEIVSAGESVLVKSGQRSYASLDRSPSNAESFNSFEMDEFDRWSEEREERYAQTISNNYVKENVVYHIHELDYYGDWRYHPIYHTHVWRPRVSFGWRPYSWGYWRWYPCGWTWISYEPWGWAPYHYGWWDWRWDWGWYWVPDIYWSSAWVTWAVGPGYIGWRPINIYKYNYYNFSNFDPNRWTFIPRNAITRKDIKKVKYNVDQIKRLKVNQTQLYQPRIRTAHLKQPIKSIGDKTRIKELKSIPRDIAKTKVDKAKVSKPAANKVYSHRRTTPITKKTNKAVPKNRIESGNNKRIEHREKVKSLKKRLNVTTVKPKTGTKKSTPRSSPKRYSKPTSQKTKSTKAKPKSKSYLRSSINQSSREKLSRRNYSSSQNQNKSSYRRVHSNDTRVLKNTNSIRTTSKYYSKSGNKYRSSGITNRSSIKRNYSGSKYTPSYKNRSYSNSRNYSQYSRPSTTYRSKSSISRNYKPSYSSSYKSRSYTPSYNRSINSRLKSFSRATKSSIKPSYRSYSSRSYSGSSSKSSYRGSSSSRGSYKSSGSSFKSSSKSSSSKAKSK